MTTKRRTRQMRRSDPNGTCRGCGKPIYWITTKKNGKHIPCDPELIPVYEGGKEILFKEDGDTLKGTTNQKEGGKLLGCGRKAHWATCEKADSFRGGQR